MYGSSTRTEIPATFAGELDSAFATLFLRISNLLSQFLRLVISLGICWLAQLSDSGPRRSRRLRRLRRIRPALRPL